MKKRDKRKRQLKTKQWYAGCKQAPRVNRRSKPTAGIPAFYRSSRWLGLRSYVLHRDGNTCQYCGGRAIQADHVHPRKSGGADAVENLVACCTSCNRVAGGRVFASFDAKKAWIVEHRGVGLYVVPAHLDHVALPKPKPVPLPSALSAQGEHAAVVRAAVARDGKRCVICQQRCERVIRVSMAAEVTLSNAATLCPGCERAARTLPPEVEMNARAVRGKRSIGL